MPRRKIISIIVGLVLAGGYWLIENRGQLGNLGLGGKNVPSSSTNVGDYERLAGCTLITGRNSDGDSFHVRHGNDEYEFRLYFVDTPESKYKTYGRGENNGKRLREQGEYFGGLDQKQTTSVGMEGKKFTLKTLGDQPFTVYTTREGVYGNERFYCLVQIGEGENTKWLREMLVEKGLVRIHTKGADLPDGTPWHKERDRLKGIEKGAKKAKLGGWR